MRDGVYVLRLTASVFESTAKALIRQNHIVSQGESFQLSGTVTRTSSHAVGTFSVQLEPDAVGNGSLPHESFTLVANGLADQSEFDLVGAGPLGLIVELIGAWESAVDSSTVT